MADEQDDKNNTTKVYILQNYEVLMLATMIPAFWNLMSWNLMKLQRKLLPHLLLVPPKRPSVSTVLHCVTFQKTVCS